MPEVPVDDFLNEPAGGGVQEVSADDFLNGAAPPGSPSPSPSPGGAAPPSLISTLMRGIGEGLNLPNRILGEGVERLSGYTPQGQDPGAGGFWSDVFMNPQGASVAGYASEGAKAQAMGYRPPQTTAEKVAAGTVGAATKFGTEALLDPTSWMFGAGKIAQVADKVNMALGGLLAAGAAPDMMAAAGELKRRLDAGDRSPETIQAAMETLMGAGVVGVGAASAGGAGVRALRGAGQAPGAPVRLDVPTEVLDQVWAQDPGYLGPADPGVGSRRAGIESARTEGVDLPPARVIPQETPEGTRIMVDDGRHRIAVARDAGDKSIPIEVAPEDVAAVRRLMSRPEVDLLNQPELLDNPDLRRTGRALREQPPDFLAQFDDPNIPKEARDAIAAGEQPAFELSPEDRRSLMEAVVSPQLRAAHRLERTLEPSREAWQAGVNRRVEEAGMDLTGEARSRAQRAAQEGKFLTPEGTTLDEARVREDYREPAQWIKDLVYDEVSAVSTEHRRTVLNALPKLLENKYLQRNEIDAIREATGIKLRDVDPSNYRRMAGFVASAARALYEAPRTFVFGGDDSWIGRQGFIPTMNLLWNGKQRRAFKDAYVKHWVAVKKDNYIRLNEAMQETDRFRVADRYGVSFTDLQGRSTRMKPDDVFLNIADVERVLRAGEKIPVLGIVPKAARKVLDASQQMYNTMGNEMRLAEFWRLAEDFGIDVDAATAGKLTPEQNDMLKAAASWANVSTGRGDVRMGLGEGLFDSTKTSASRRQQMLLQGGMRPLAYLFSSPSFQLARLQSVDPSYYLKLKRLSPQVAREAAKQTARAYATAMSIVAGVGASGLAAVEWDPDSSDFAKVRVGNTRYDLGGGFTQMVRAALQLKSGEKKTLEGKTIPQTRTATVAQQVTNKLHPSARLLYDTLAGRADVNDATIANWAANTFEPAFLQDILEQLDTDPRWAPIITSIALGGHGAGITIYDEPAEYTDEGRLLLDETITPLERENRDNARSARARERRTTKPGKTEPIDLERTLRRAQRRQSKLRRDYDSVDDD